jgi:hypothetical protein
MVQLAVAGVVVDRSIVVLPAAFRLRFLALMVIDVLGALGDGPTQRRCPRQRRLRPGITRRHPWHP